MGDNIRYDGSVVASKISAINGMVNEFLSSAEAEYNAIKSGISKSSCEHMDALLENIESEKKAAEEIAAFLLKMTSMMKSASESLDNVENNYSTQKVD